MDRLKRSVLKSTTFATPAIRDGPAALGAPPSGAAAASASLQQHPNIGGLGLSNAVLDESLDGALPICMTTMGDEALMIDLGEVRNMVLR